MNSWLDALKGEIEDNRAKIAGGKWRLTKEITPRLFELWQAQGALGNGEITASQNEIKLLLLQEYKTTTTNLGEVMDLVVQVEVFLQALQGALGTLQGDALPQPSAEQDEVWSRTPIASLFNVAELSKGGGEVAPFLDRVRKAIYAALTTEMPMLVDPGISESACCEFADRLSKPVAKEQRKGSVKPDLPGGLWG